MKKLVLILFFTLLLPLQAFSTSNPPDTFVAYPTWFFSPWQEVDISFTRSFKYTYTPTTTGTEITVDAVEINGAYLYLSNPQRNIHTIPVIKLGGYGAGVPLTVLAQGPIGTSTTKKSVIAQLPDNILGGLHSLMVQTFARNTAIGIGGSAARSSVMIEASNIVPDNSVILFSGAINTIPSGWQLCDGTNTHPNLKNKFVVGAGDTYAVGATGGRKTIAGHVLSINEMPSHNHSYSQGWGESANKGHVGAGRALQANTPRNRTTSSKGAGQAHSHGDNRPPYHALAYICKN